MIPALLAGTGEDRRAGLADVGQAEPMKQAGQVERQRCGLDGMEPRWQVAPAGELVARLGALEAATGLVWVVGRTMGAHRPTSSQADVSAVEESQAGASSFSGRGWAARVATAGQVRDRLRADSHVRRHSGPGVTAAVGNRDGDGVTRIGESGGQ